MANTSIYNAFERMWQHTGTAVDGAKKYANEKAVATLKSAKNYTDKHFDIVSGDTLSILLFANDKGNITLDQYPIHANAEHYSYDDAGNQTPTDNFLTEFEVKVSDSILTLDDLSNGLTLSIDLQSNLSSYTTSYSFTSDDVKLTDYGAVITTTVDNYTNDCFYIVQESSVGIRYDDSRGDVYQYITFPESGLYLSLLRAINIMSEVFTPQEGERAEKATYSITIPNYTDFVASKTLKLEHLTEHNHDSSYYTKDTIDIKLASVKNHMDKHFDIATGSDTCKGIIPMNDSGQIEDNYIEKNQSGFVKLHVENEDDLGEGMAAVIVEALMTPTLLSDATPTLEDFANGATFVVESDAPNSKRFTYEFTSDDIISHTHGSYTWYEVLSYDSSGTQVLVSLKIIPEELVGVDVDEGKNGLFFNIAGIHMSPLIAAMELPFLDADGNVDDTLKEGTTYVSVTLTINNYTGFETSKTLKSEHIPDTISTKSYVSDSISTAIEAAIGGSY